MLDDDEGVEGRSISGDAGDDGGVLGVLLDGESHLAARKPLVDNDALLLGIGIPVDASFVNIEDESRRDVVHQRFRGLEEPLDFGVVDVEAGRFRRDRGDDLGLVAPFQSHLESVNGHTQAFDSEDFGDEVVEGHRLVIQGRLLDPVGDVLKVVVGQDRRLPQVFVVDVRSAQDGTDALAVGDVEKLGQFRVGDVLLNALVGVDEASGEVDLLLERFQAAELFISRKSAENGLEFQACLLMEEGTSPLDRLPLVLVVRRHGDCYNSERLA